MSLKKSRLYQYALSDANIFSAIYSIESYIYEKGLLSSDDIELYYKLTDKFNFTHLSEVIHICKRRLDKVLNDDNELFNTHVYFQIKKKIQGTDEITYRPIHSASLIDQICMVSLLNVIMYEIKFDSDNVKESEKKEATEECFTKKIQLSGLAKLLPSNFYGNIPSTQPEKLFVDWKSKYKEYSDAVINKYYEYSKNNKYSHEVCLDIKDFFPSIDPKHIFDFIINKLSTEFRDNDLNCLQTIVSKLLYFELSNIDSEWSNAYYGEHPIIIDDKYYCKGIAQGLPQSYFFGNICMIKIAQCVEKFYPGDAYYYVDDSVIYTSNGSDKIENINEAIKEIKWAAGKMNEPYINERLLQKQTECNYSIKIYPNGEKSTITPISEAYNGLTSLKTLAGLTSNINNAIYLSVDEIEDTSTEKKIEAIVCAIDQAKKEIKKKDNLDKSSLYRLKLLNRYRKFFIFRLKIIQNRNFDDVNILDKFLQKYGISREMQVFNLDNFFEKYEEDIFQGEIRLLFSLLNTESVECEKLRTALNNFDYSLAKRGEKNKISSILYLSKDIDSAIILANQKSQKYKSLQEWCYYQFKLPYKSTPKKQQDHLEKAIIDIRKSKIFKGAEYAMTVFDLSNEYKRCLINAVISRIVNIPLSDDLIFYKQDNRSVKYYEFRLLAFARNRFFKFDRFMSLASDVLQNADGDSDVVDYKIMDALHIFIAKVNDPEKVDSLILVHRLVNGLWKNGSKFLHFYTLHNEEHSVELIKNVVRLVNTIDYFSLKKLDFYILFLACYLHDISMVIHPNIETFCEENNDTNNIYSNFIESLCDSKKPVINKNKPEIKQFILEYFKMVFEYFENSVRSVHAQQSAKFIIDRCETPYLKFIDKAILQTVAHVSEAHGYDCEEVYGRKSFAKTEIYSLKYMMILIRMADLLDLSKDRVSYYIMKENIKHMSKVSQFHWISHYITDNCTIKASFKPIYNDEKSKIRPLDSGSIIEQLSFDIYLNTRQITKVEPSNKARYCSKIGCEHFISEGKLVININEPNATTTQECQNKDCTFICNWITMKHEYLFSELHALLKYLNTVNNGLFRTAIEVNVHYENKRDLDPEFNDIVMNYISPLRS